MKETFAWIPVEIKSYRALYKGRRFWVFENDFERPYDIYDDPKWNQVLLFDANIGCIRAVGRWRDDGGIDGCAMWGQGVDFIATDPADMISSVCTIDKWYC